MNVNLGNSINQSLDNKGLATYLSKQLNNFFPDNDEVTVPQMLSYVSAAEDRVYHCFNGIRKKYFNEGSVTKFNHLISDQYCMYIYMLANHIYKNGGEEHVSTKLYYLNKALHSVDIFYTTQLPSIFLLVHPIGTILGRAEFSDYFIAYQGCTVGCLNEGVFPVFKGRTIMYANSSVLGTSEIGNNVCFAAGATVANQSIPSNKTVFGSSPSISLRDNMKDIHDRPPYKYGS